LSHLTYKLPYETLIKGEIKGKVKGMKNEEEEVSSYSMAARKRENIGTGNKKS